MSQQRHNTPPLPTTKQSDIYNITLSLPDKARLSTFEINKAKADLIETAYFKALNDTNVPYAVHIHTEHRKLIIKIKNNQGTELPMLIVSLSPYRKLIEDYYRLIDSYQISRANYLSREKLEVIDMARRGIHNEGAMLLMDRLKHKAVINFSTARRLFTLIAAL